MLPIALFGVCARCKCTQVYRQSSLRRRFRSKSEDTCTFTIEYCQFGHQAGLEVNIKFVTKFNHSSQLAWGLYYMSMPNGLTQAQSQWAL